MPRDRTTVAEQTDAAAFQGGLVRAALQHVCRQRPDPDEKLAEYAAALILDLWDPRSPNALNYQRIQAAFADGAWRLTAMSQEFKRLGEGSEQG